MGFALHKPLSAGVTRDNTVKLMGIKPQGSFLAGTRSGAKFSLSLCQSLSLHLSLYPPLPPILHPYLLSQGLL